MRVDARVCKKYAEVGMNERDTDKLREVFRCCLLLSCSVYGAEDGDAVSVRISH